MNISVLLLGNEMKMEGISNSHVNKIIDGFFNTLQSIHSSSMPIKKNILEPPINLEETKSTTFKTPISNSVGSAIQMKEEKPGVVVGSHNPVRPRQLPKINSERSLNMSIADIISEKDKHIANAQYNEDYSIKYIENEPHYRCSYHCEKCGHSGRRYVKKTYDFIRCHECNTKLTKELAVPGSQKLEKDSDSNYFIAREMLDENQ